MKIDKTKIAKKCDKMRKYFVALGVIGLLLAIINKKHPIAFFQSEFFGPSLLAVLALAHLCLFLYAHGSEVLFISGVKYDRKTNPGTCNMMETIYLCIFMFFTIWFFKKMFGYL